MLAVFTDLPRGRFEETLVPAFIDVGAIEALESLGPPTQCSNGPEMAVFAVAESLPLADRASLTPAWSNWSRAGEAVLAPAC